MIFLTFPTFRKKDWAVWRSQPAGQAASQLASQPANRLVSSLPTSRHSQNLNFSLKSRISQQKSRFSCENTDVLKPWAQNTCVFIAEPWFVQTCLTFWGKLKPWKILINDKTPVFSQLNLDLFRLFRLFEESWNLGKSWKMTKHLCFNS